jgi:hypothetical protein
MPKQRHPEEVERDGNDESDSSAAGSLGRIIVFDDAGGFDHTTLDFNAMPHGPQALHITAGC